MQAAAKNLSSKPATTGSRAQHHMSIFDLNGDGKVDAEDFRIAAERAHLAGKEMSTFWYCLLYTSPSPRDQRGSRMPSSA